MTKNLMFRIWATLSSAILLVAFGSALLAEDPGTKAGTAGYVVDDKCGVKGANDHSEACTKKCLDAGAKMAIVTDKDQKVLTVENPEMLKGHEGHHVAITGTVKGDSIHIDSVKML